MTAFSIRGWRAAAGCALAVAVWGSTGAARAEETAEKTILKETPGCGSWSEQDRQACSFAYGKHDYRIFRPDVIEAGKSLVVYIDFDHTKALRGDDHVTLRWIIADCGAEARVAYGEREDRGRFKTRAASDDWEKNLVSFGGRVRDGLKDWLKDQPQCGGKGGGTASAPAAKAPAPAKAGPKPAAKKADAKPAPKPAASKGKKPATIKK